jgi:hypothetical protein
MFEPSRSTGPSGLADLPRPFVFRARHLDGSTVAAGESFHFDFHWFDVRRHSLDTAIAALAQFTPEAELVDVHGADAPIELCLNPSGDPASRILVNHIMVRFETPTELKGGGETVDRPEFGVFFARIRDRISTLRALYDDGPLTINFREFGERAARIQMSRCDVRHVETSRRSSRTGQTHSLGGFVGEAEYEGDLTELVPYLRAAQWTGVGRQTAWGKGELTLYTVRSEV